jgi:diacylglycerol kinase family enzyme
MNGPLCLVVNPAAGRGRSLKAAAAARAALDEAGVVHQAIHSASLAHARELAAAAAARGDIVVAVGGDGMAGALAGAVADAGGTYAVIPGGRGNDFAREIGMPADPAAAARAILAGAPRPMDLIGIGVPGQPDLSAALCVYLGVPSIAGEIANRARFLRGPAAYPVAALRAVAGWEPATFRVEPDRDGTGTGTGTGTGDGDGGGDSSDGGSDGSAVAGEYAAYAVVVANARYFGGGMQVAPPALTDDGRLDIVTLRHGPKRAFIQALLRIRSGTHLAMPLVSISQSAAVTVTVDRAMPAAADGEILPGAGPLPAGAPLRIRALPRALTVIGPR